MGSLQFYLLLDFIIYYPPAFSVAALIGETIAMDTVGEFKSGDLSFSKN